MTKRGERELCDDINFPSVRVEDCSLSLQRQRVYKESVFTGAVRRL